MHVMGSPLQYHIDTTLKCYGFHLLIPVLQTLATTDLTVPMIFVSYNILFDGCITLSYMDLSNRPFTMGH